MRKKLIQVAAAALAVLLCLSALPSQGQAYATDEGGQIMRIGLAYGSNALASANLQNSTGSGYRFGYFNSDRTFTTVGSTAETKITVLKTQNLYLTSGGEYVTAAPLGNYAVIGCYHVELPGTYPSYEEAQRAASTVSGAFPAYINGTFTVRVGAYATKGEAERAQASLSIANTAIKGTTSNGVSVVKTGTADILLQFDCGSEHSLGIMPGQDNSVKTVTWFKGYQYYGGFQYQRFSGNLNVVNFVPLEDYLKGVLPYEMSLYWPLEALKAQAVCARNYGMQNLNKHKSYGFDLCNGTDCQVYRGLNSAGASTNNAVDQTAGMYLKYNGKLAETYYYASNGGGSEDVANVWGANYAYLKGINDPYEAAVASQVSNYNWSTTFTAEELTKLLRSKNYSCGNIVKFEVTERSKTGNVIGITFTDADGKTIHLTRERVRTTLGLRSMRYSVSSDGASAPAGGSYTITGGKTVSGIDGLYTISGSGNVGKATSGTPYAVTGSGTEALKPGNGSVSNGGAGTTFTITGSGNGHHVGMSQWGAYAMAKQGYTYKDILTFYFTDVTVG